ncbi:hypothetical protein BH09PSE1_BH09PSE1_29480 [soil metagenome]
MRRLFAAVCAVAALGGALPAFAQDTTPQTAPPAEDGWDVFRDPSRSMLMAYADFGSGVGVAVRCVGRSYEAVITGLPATESETRPLRIRFAGHDADIVQRWNVAQDGTVAASSFPARFARDLRKGGSLGIVVPDAAADGRDLRFALDLPSSGAAIDETLAACGLPVVDPRADQITELGENGLPPGLEWRVRPHPRFPRTDYVRGVATLSCLTRDDGSLDQCTIESEYPPGAGFGATALSGLGDARLRTTDGSPMTVRMVMFRVNFRTNAIRNRASGRVPR